MTGPEYRASVTRSNQVWSLGYKFAHAAARLDENRAVRIEHASSLGTI